jgi:DNA-binding transcriptional ArsR family regulator
MPAARPNFIPEPFLPISDPRQLKAFTDPLRNRMLHILCHREATNQQMASTIGEPPAKVLHHLRFLEEVGLVVLVEQRVRGGNVEKFYRATAQLYGFRPEGLDGEEFAKPVTGALLETVTQEFMASHTLWPQQELFWEGRTAYLAPARVGEFNARMQELIEEFWNDDTPGGEAQQMAMGFVMYRFPGSDEA